MRRAIFGLAALLGLAGSFAPLPVRAQSSWFLMIPMNNCTLAAFGFTPYTASNPPYSLVTGGMLKSPDTVDVFDIAYHPLGGDSTTIINQITVGYSWLASWYQQDVVIITSNGNTITKSENSGQTGAFGSTFAIPDDPIISDAASGAFIRIHINAHPSISWSQGNDDLQYIKFSTINLSGTGTIPDNYYACSPTLTPDGYGGGGGTSTGGGGTGGGGTGGGTAAPTVTPTLTPYPAFTSVPGETSYFFPFADWRFDTLAGILGGSYGGDGSLIGASYYGYTAMIAIDVHSLSCIAGTLGLSFYDQVDAGTTGLNVRIDINNDGSNDNWGGVTNTSGSVNAVNSWGFSTSGSFNSLRLILITSGADPYASLIVSRLGISCTSDVVPTITLTPTITASYTAAPSTTPTFTPSAWKICLPGAITATLRSSTKTNFALTQLALSSITPPASATPDGSVTPTITPYVAYCQPALNITHVPIAIVTAGACIRSDGNTPSPDNPVGCNQACYTVLPAINISTIGFMGSVFQALALGGGQLGGLQTSLTSPAVRACIRYMDFHVELFGNDLTPLILTVISSTALFFIVRPFRKQL